MNSRIDKIGLATKILIKSKTKNLYGVRSSSFADVFKEKERGYERMYINKEESKETIILFIFLKIKRKFLKNYCRK